MTCLVRCLDLLAEIGTCLHDYPKLIQKPLEWFYFAVQEFECNVWTVALCCKQTCFSRQFRHDAGIRKLQVRHGRMLPSDPVTASASAVVLLLYGGPPERHRILYTESEQSGAWMRMCSVNPKP